MNRILLFPSSSLSVVAKKQQETTRALSNSLTANGFTHSRRPAAAINWNRYNVPQASSSSVTASSFIRHKSTFSTATATFDQSVDSFPSIVIGPDRSIEPQGSFAEAQAEFLDPDPDAVASLAEGLLNTNMGIVAHYYMDVELQGILQALKNVPGLEHRIGIADSLRMGDMAVDMCQKDGVTSVVCLGVDFMSESVQAILSKNGLQDVPVYRASAKHIGCSLAESAEGDAYRAWLQKEGASENALHVIYINTSLETKAISSSLVPTITCTSSNVLQTMLQAAHQIPNVRLLYGPDTYMGENLQTLLDVIVSNPDWTDEKIGQDLHPHHSNATLKTLRNNMVVFPQGNCVVHHMFGNQVVQTVREHYYDDCFLTAHLEVPGEMFEIAMEKSLVDQGVVGSTSDILNFITRKVQEAVTSDNSNKKQQLKFILGTEAGMVTFIVQSVQHILQQTGNPNVQAEIIFPVSSEAVMSTDDDNTYGNFDQPLAVVPGVAGGEGCSTAGGCATCPFMKMNNVEALEDIIQMVDENNNNTLLQKHLPPNRLEGKQINGRDALDLGTESILYMRHFMTHKQHSEELVQKVLTSSSTK